MNLGKTRAMERKSPIFTPPEGMPRVERPSPEIFAGTGEAGIYRMLSDFYKKLEKSEVRHLFPEDMELASRKSATFFIQLLGGPPLFSQTYGPPRMRQRHFPFEIDEKARQVWLQLFLETLEGAEEKYGFPPEHLEGFRSFLREFSRWMVNKGG
ncbi:MAG TPA: hypothetical protein ENK02_14850 [Planctomycetes bacterium]|nr:hypothetical protein [Planctomycetota bacterium]